MPVRRCADPASVQHVWNAIRVSAHQKQMPDTAKIIKYLQKVTDCSPSQAELYLKQSFKDGLVIAQMKTVGKGLSVTEPLECYKIPSEEMKIPQDDGIDWYCIECHLAGDVTACKYCFRVFHQECLKNARRKLEVFKLKANKISDHSKPSIVIEAADVNTSLNNNSDDNIELLNGTTDEAASSTNKVNAGPNTKLSSYENYIYDEEMCSICNLSKVDIDCGVTKEELNHLLSFVLSRIRSWLPENLTNTMGGEPVPEWLTEQERSWRGLQLFYQHVDMAVMELKLRCQEYTMLCDFYADVITIQHNVAIYHGIESQEYGAADLMLLDCIHDLNELRNCADCYKHSNEKIHDKWFCLPCRIPHDLVWAKQKGYPYWPAKVIRETETNFDVRYFGAKNERSVLPKSCIKPITTNMNTIQIKKTPAFRKSYEELLLHQKLIADPNELNYLEVKKYKKKPVKTRHSAPPNLGKKLVEKKRKSSVKSPRKSKEVYDIDSDLSDEEWSNKYAKRKSEASSSSTPYKKMRVLRSQHSVSTNLAEKVESGTEPPSKNTSSDIINISDGEDSEYTFAADEYQFGGSFDNGEQVTSSTEYFRTADNFNPNSENSMHQLDQPYCDAVEKMRRKLETTADKNHLIKVAMDCMQSEIDKLTNDHNEHLKKLFESHNAQISETKKKQWCYNCEQDAIYHCCWNTAYCSPTCQQQHWQAEHKKVCRRKR